MFDVLIVEDEALTALALKERLLGLGYDDIAIASTLDEGLALAREARFCFAILDVNIRGETSFAIARRLEARETPFFFTTGYGAVYDFSDFEEVARLSKPFSAVALQDAIEAAVGSSVCE